MSTIPIIAENILQQYTAMGYELDSKLNPGLSPAQIDSILKKEGIQLDEATRSLYTWRNGTNFQKGQLLMHSYFLPPCHYFVSLPQAIQTYKSLSKSDHWQSDWFPILSDEGGGFVVVSNVMNEQGPHEVIDISEEGIDTCHNSLYQMLLTLHTGIEEGAIYVDKDQSLELVYPQYKEIGKRLNPGCEYWEVS